MNRTKSEYNATKLTSISNGKTIIDTYVDSFYKEKVKIVVAELDGSKRRIYLNIDFPDFFRLAAQIKSQAYLEKTITAANPLEICRGGYGSGNDATATSMTLGRNENKYFFNAMSCPGVRTANGAVIPIQGIQESQRTKISVPTDYKNLLAMFMYVEKAVNVYLETVLLPELFEKAKTKQESQKTHQDTGYYPDPQNDDYYPDPPSYDDNY